MNKGFVVLHRKNTEWEWYSDTNVFRVFTHLRITPAGAGKSGAEPSKELLK